MKDGGVGKELRPHLQFTECYFIWNDYSLVGMADGSQACQRIGEETSLKHLEGRTLSDHVLALKNTI